MGPSPGHTTSRATPAPGSEVLLSFPGVGPKCANLVLGIACGQARIGVDVHVHRVTNLWGYVRQARLLVPFGKHVCTGKLPRCSSCPVLDMCRQVGVEAHR